MSEQHQWQFFRAGGVDQVVIRNGADVRHIGELDQKLWVALACPTRGLEFDTRTLDLIDTDHDGRIRAPELIAACRWTCARLRDPDVLMEGSDAIALTDIADEPDETITLADEARRVLALAGKEGAEMIALADVVQRTELLTAMRFNGDGVVTPETSKDDAAVRATLLRIVQTHGSVKDRNGIDGIDRMRAEAFFAEAEALRAWHAGEGAPGGHDPVLLAAAEAVNAVREKVDDFFARCRVAAFDPQAVAALNASSENYEALGAQSLHLQTDGIAALPLAAIRPGRSLPLREGANPAWADALDALHEQAVAPVLGDTLEVLDEAAWNDLLQRLEPSQQWLERKPASALAGEDVDAIATLLDTRGALMALIAEDESVERHNARLVDLEKLLRFKRDLVRLLNNFVSFSDFYRRVGAIFQAGTLYLDGRSCDLTVQVADAKQHAVLAGLAKTCLAYCECTREGRKMGIVAAFTAGDVDFLFVGRNGLFYDRQGHDWDATITRLIENPTSVAQAFFSPYKKFVRMIEEQVAKRAAASEASAQGTLGTLASTLAHAGAPPPAGAAVAAPAAAPAIRPLPQGRIDVGTVAAIGVAMGSISAVLVALFSKFIDLGQWIPIAIVGMVLAISGPSMLIAWLKLHQRSLGPILDASGWAINGRMKVNVRLGASLSKTAQVPRRASRILHDPFADRRGLATALAALALVAVATLLVWQFGLLDARLPSALQHAPPGAVRQAS
ncbi:hypothetical protein QTH87_05340 [Variovorax sp. J22P168]|uniref:hypothetical protein n=1 Tax=Variovorax jilinensis TaxID=3053513 RepID=UPI002578CA8B|nr:hypothetical protein [Variovorax sp. J22P168]MDM0011859.1 hypothetical protein [Variovorax sp. J22P168]